LFQSFREGKNKRKERRRLGEHFLLDQIGGYLQKDPLKERKQKENHKRRWVERSVHKTKRATKKRIL